MCRGVAAETEMRSAGDLGEAGGTTDQAHVPVGIVVPPAWDLEADLGVGADLAAAADVDNLLQPGTMIMTARTRKRILASSVWFTCGLGCLFLVTILPARQDLPQLAPASVGVAKGAGPKTFGTPQEAADALIDAAKSFDVEALEEIFGSTGDDIVLSGEYGQDRQRATDFAAQAREKKTVSVDPKTASRAFLLVGDEDWPFPVPIVKEGDHWFFDAKAGRQELLNRRIGSNEMDAIDICHGYVEAQYDYAFRKRQGYEVNQYAQRIVSTPGTQDGLAWQDPDGGWDGPIGEKIARAIENGYSADAQPYHGYFFKILKGQGPAAPLGEMDYVVKGVMIGGFALVAAPAEYGESGVMSFIVSQDGVVYQKDLGPDTLSAFANMARFNPDKTWDPVPDTE